MRVYFLSYTPAVLKLNGLYVGTIDLFERHIELDPADGVLAEIVPGDNLQPVNFFLNGKFFSSPPPFCDVYLMDGDALVYIREYGVKDVTLSVIYQTRFYGNLITVFSQGGIYLSCEGSEYTLTRLPQCFSKLQAQTEQLSGREVLALDSGGYLVVISDDGKVIFENRADDFTFGESLKMSAAFETCTAAKAECEFSFDGEKLNLVSSRTVETRPPEDEIAHFAFFESVLTRGNFADYLDSELKPRAADLKSYLGEFVSVTVPPEKFFTVHGEIKAAGLVYPKSKNLFEVKYFAVDADGGKISNIYPVE